MRKKWRQKLTPIQLWIILTLLLIILFIAFIILVVPKNVPIQTKVILIVAAVVLAITLSIGFARAAWTKRSRPDEDGGINQSDKEASVPPMPVHKAPYMTLQNSYLATDALPGEDFTVIDVETTGLDPSNNDILEIGAIRYRHHKAVDYYHSFICPLGKIDPESQAKNHIAWADVANAPYLRDEFPNFLKFIGDDLIMGYFVSYDIKFLQTRTGQSISNVTFDVWDFVKKAVYSPNYKLDTLRAKYKLKGVPHTALGDCESTAELYFRCLKDPAARSEVLLRKKNALTVEQRYAR